MAAVRALEPNHEHVHRRHSETITASLQTPCTVSLMSNGNEPCSLNRLLNDLLELAVRDPRLPNIALLNITDIIADR